jgi:hypothetical protein
MISPNSTGLELTRAMIPIALASIMRSSLSGARA